MNHNEHGIERRNIQMATKTQTSPFRKMNVTLDLTTIDPINYPVRTVEPTGIAIPRRCTINIAEAHQMIADAQALNAKIAAEAAAIRNSK